MAIPTKSKKTSGLNLKSFFDRLLFNNRENEGVRLEGDSVSELVAST